LHAELSTGCAVPLCVDQWAARATRKETLMRGKLLITSAAVLLAGTLACAAQSQPQEPRGEESSRSSTPHSQLPGPDTRGQGTVRQGAPSAAGQSTPQEPRGEESTESSMPRGQQPPPVRGQER